MSAEKATYYELHEGVKGNGETKWMVVAVRKDTGQWQHVHEFDSKSEAEHCIKWGMA